MYSTLRQCPSVTKSDHCTSTNSATYEQHGVPQNSHIYRALDICRGRVPCCNCPLLSRRADVNMGPCSVITICTSKEELLGYVELYKQHDSNDNGSFNKSIFPATVKFNLICTYLCSFTNITGIPIPI